MIVKFNHVKPDKLSLSFTWDDNFERHHSQIAPAFENIHKYCTFYINPGESDFTEKIKNNCQVLEKKGFDLGSHGYTHLRFSHLDKDQYRFQLTESQNAIAAIIGRKPSTFAFPHHDFTADMLPQAHEIYLATRNTLSDTRRYSLESQTSVPDVENWIRKAASEQHSLVFSGHSVSLETDGCRIDGYEPIPIGILHKILDIILKYEDYFDICTLEQAALKKYMIENCEYTPAAFTIKRHQQQQLLKYGLSPARISAIM